METSLEHGTVGGLERERLSIRLQENQLGRGVRSCIDHRNAEEKDGPAWRCGCLK